MNALRSRIARIEAAIDSGFSVVDRERQETFQAQLVDLTDEELERLENIVVRMNVLEEDRTGFIRLPEGCEHLRDFIAFVEKDEAAYFSGIAEVE